MIAPYEVRARALYGTPYVEYSLWVRGQSVRQQLHPFSEDQIRDALHPKPAPPMRPFDAPTKLRPGPKKAPTPVFDDE